MKFLDDRYASVYTHKGYDICTLKVCVPENGEELGYRVDSEKFEGQTFKEVQEAVSAIDAVLCRSLE